MAEDKVCEVVAIERCNRKRHRLHKSVAQNSSQWERDSWSFQEAAARQGKRSIFFSVSTRRWKWYSNSPPPSGCHQKSIQPAHYQVHISSISIFSRFVRKILMFKAKRRCRILFFKKIFKNDQSGRLCYQGGTAWLQATKKWRKKNNWRFQWFRCHQCGLFNWKQFSLNDLNMSKKAH